MIYSVFFISLLKKPGPNSPTEADDMSKTQMTQIRRAVKTTYAPRKVEIKKTHLQTGERCRGEAAKS